MWTHGVHASERKLEIWKEWKKDPKNGLESQNHDQ